MKIKVVFAWFDFWVGVFFDKRKRRIYILPVPMLGFCIELPLPWDYTLPLGPLADTRAESERE